MQRTMPLSKASPMLVHPGMCRGCSTYLFATVLDGRNAYLIDGVQPVLGREPKDFADGARAIAATETWKVAA
jgi:hypothetical protein